jgi:hypothetical protein
VKQKSPYELIADLQGQVGRLLRSFDIDSLPADERKILQALKRQTADARLDVRDYGLAETAAGQRSLAEATRTRLRELDDMFIKAGGMNLIGAADVAQLSATTQQLMADI